jgi:hypothetical protein
MPPKSNPVSVASFSQLTYLLHLVTSLNTNDALQSSFNRQRGNANNDTSSHPLNTTLLDSVVAILVQQHDVVAACFISDKVTVMVAETDPSPATDPEIDLDDSDVPLVTPGPHTFYPLQLAAVSNPRFDSSNNAKPNDWHNVQIQADGDNIWTKVRDSNKWYCVFM